jgi:hypothetical protein
MRNKHAAPAEGRERIPRSRIRSDLERMGLTPELSDDVAGRLEASVARLSQREYSAVLGSFVAVYEERSVREDPGIGPEDIAEVQRLMQGFSEEVQKLDEGLRMLEAYVSRLRRRGAQTELDSIH